MSTQYPVDFNLQPQSAAHHKNERFTCDECGSVYKYKDNLQRHIQGVHDGGERRPFGCAECTKTYTRKYNLKKHILSVHSEDGDERRRRRPFGCAECTKTYTQKNDLKKHILSVHSEDGDERRRPLSCAECTKTYTRKDDLKKHILSVHSEDGDDRRRPFGCAECTKTYTRRSYLKKHFMRVHSEDGDERKRPFGCAEFTKTYTQRYDLKRHFLSVRSKETVFTSGNAGAILFKHKVSFHAESLRVAKSSGLQCRRSDEKFYKCNFCETVFKYKRSLQRHVSLHHNKKTPLFKVQSDGAKSCDSKKKMRVRFRMHLESVKNRKLQSRRDEYHQLLGSEKLKEKLMLSSYCQAGQNTRSSKSWPTEVTNSSVQIPNSMMHCIGEADREKSERVKNNENSCRNPNACPSCLKSFMDYNGLIEHAKMCAKYALVVREERNKAALKAPLKRQYECSICKATLSSARCFHAHLKEMHDMNFVFHLCDRFACEKMVHLSTATAI